MTMNKITLAGFAAENAPAYICEKAQRAWAHSAIIIARSEAGETQTALADEYDVSQGTIYRILKTFGKTKKQRKAKATNTSFITQWDQSKRGALQRDLKNTRTALDQAEKDLAWARKDLIEAEERADSYKADLKAACFRAAEAEKLADKNVEALQADLAAAKANEQAAVDRLTDGDSWANRWQNEYLQAKADLEAAEAQIDQMAERLAECRNRGFWARVFNR
jgi:chromosome segregation ATPase